MENINKSSLELLDECKICPRQCKVNRNQGKKGYCKESSTVCISRAALHMWEEPCISGEEGSGAVFFSGCAMRCVFCQNHSISDGTVGKEVSIERLAEIFIELQQKGANNINLVTPSHYVVQVIEALKLAKAKGLTLPIIYNSSGYEKVETIKMLEGYIDIYLPDFKYMDEHLAKRYSNAKGYSTYAKAAIKEMVRQVGEPVFDERGIMKKGVIVRHLALPNAEEDSKAIIRYLYETYQDNIFISIMNQYTPLEGVKDYPEINRKLTDKEYDLLVDYAIDLGVENGFIQEGETQDESFIPSFDYEGV
ncbi:MAG: radical SAM protein [bacterium]|nr:radical SAM protein [bacterium]